MDTPAKSSRTNLAIQVFKQTNDGMTVSAACKAVGLPRSSYYDIYRKNPEVFKELQEYIKESEVTQLCMILASQEDITNKTIQDALATTTSPKDRLAIAKYIFELEEELSHKYLRGSSKNMSAREILTGPIETYVESRR